jgi:hypothetical protein
LILKTICPKMIGNFGMQMFIDFWLLMFWRWPMKMSKIVFVKTVENGNWSLTPKCRKPNSLLHKNAENWFSKIYCLFFMKKNILNYNHSLAGCMLDHFIIIIELFLVLKKNYKWSRWRTITNSVQERKNMWVRLLDPPQKNWVLKSLNRHLE